MAVNRRMREVGPAAGGLSAGQARRLPAGFTLLEIILVLALIGLIGAMVTAGIVRVVDADHPSPEDLFWQACRSAEKMASLSDRTVTLSFDEKTRALVWTNGDESGRAPFNPEDGEVSVQFLQPQSDESRILIGGQVVETQTVPAVSFYPNGTCSDFRVQFRVNKHTRRIAIDPWTCAPILETKKEGT